MYNRVTAYLVVFCYLPFILSGKTKSIKHKIPFELIYYETVEQLEGAVKKEKYFKSGFGRKHIKNKINMDW